MTGTVYAPAVREIKDLIDTGKLGEMVQVFAQKSYPYHDRRPQDNGVDGGLLMQTGVHAVGYVRYVTGLEFEDIVATDTRRGNPADGDLRMAGQIAGRMTGGVLCTILCNYCNPKGIGFWGNDQLRIHGTGGMAEVVDAGGRSLVALGDDKPVPLDNPDFTASYPQLFSSYVDHLLDGSDMLLSKEDSFENSRVVILAQTSADTGKAVRA
jgi:predicted dehydrogenase